MSDYPYVLFYQYWTGFLIKECRFDLIRARTPEELEGKLSERRSIHKGLQPLWFWKVQDMPKTADMR